MAILVRPVREQVEHDRVIRVLQARWRRRFAVEANTGEERAASIRVGDAQLYPDLILSQTDGGRVKPHAIVEVETGESINHLEAMAQWARFGNAKTRFYLYVPEASRDTARRLCADHQVRPSEIWCYLSLGEEVRFRQVYRAPAASGRAAASASAQKTRPKAKATAPVRSTVKTPVKSTGAGAARPVKPFTGKKAVKKAPIKKVQLKKAQAKTGPVKTGPVKTGPVKTTRVKTTRVKTAKKVSKATHAATGKRPTNASARSSRGTGRPSRAAAARNAPPARVLSGRRSANAVRAQKRR